VSGRSNRPRRAILSSCDRRRVLAISAARAPQARRVQRRRTPPRAACRLRIGHLVGVLRVPRDGVADLGEKARVQPSGGLALDSVTPRSAAACQRLRLQSLPCQNRLVVRRQAHRDWMTSGERPSLGSDSVPDLTTTRWPGSSPGSETLAVHRHHRFAAGSGDCDDPAHPSTTPRLFSSRS